MKLKKKHFKELKEIAKTVNEIVPGTGVRIDKLIADIESVQKPTDEVIYEMYRKNMEDRRDGKSMFAASTDNGTQFKGLRAQVKQYDTLPGEITDAVSDIEQFLLSTIEEKPLDWREPKIGDIGYFWDEPCLSSTYGKLNLIGEAYPVKYRVVLDGKFYKWYNNFSKTPQS